LVLTVVVAAGGAEPALGPDLASRAQTGIDKALAYLVACQGADGGWEAFGRSNPAVTALVVQGLVQHDRYGPGHSAVKRGLEFILRFAQADGGIYVPGDGLPGYQTSVALMALAAARDPAFADALSRARTFLKTDQWDEGEGRGPADVWYGGSGYGQGKRPDLSNTQLMLEALHQSGLSPDDPVYRKAVVFVSRCQMLGETNDQPFAAGSTDGGFIYSPANGGESKAGTETIDGRVRLRTYGSMTYAGFKSLLYARVSRDDARVQAAYDWIRGHYTLDANPNMPEAQTREGLFYYYYVFARALHAWGEERITDKQGQPHSWRQELIEKLLSLQHPDGSWVNEADRWYEGNPHLVTAYCVLALQTCTK